MQNQTRKRLHSPAVRRKAGADAATPPSSSSTHQMESAIQLFSKKHGLSKMAVKAALRADQQEQLPSINDPDAIDAFFRRNRRRSFKDLIPPFNHHAAETSRGGQIPDDHPMKPFVDGSDKEMSVKEALARGFRNYKVRLPKAKRIDYDVIDPLPVEAYQPGSTSSIAVLFAASLKTPSVGGGDVYASSAAAAAPIRPTTSINELLASNFGTMDTYADQKLKEDSPRRSEAGDEGVEDADDAQSEQNGDVEIIETCLNESGHSADGGVDTSAMMQYTIAPFWQLNLDVSKGYKGGFYIMGVKYVQFSTLIHQDRVIVPMNERIRLIVEDTPVSLTMSQLMALNGIVVRDAAKMKELNAVFMESVFLVHHAIEEYLVSAFAPRSLSSTRKICRDHFPIKLSTQMPPFCCYRQESFNCALGTKAGENEILDESHFPRPYHFVPPSSSLVGDLIQSHERQLTVKEQLLVVTHFDGGTPVETIAEKYRVSVSAIEDIVADRDRVQSAAALVLMEEAREEVRSAAALMGTGRSESPDTIMRPRDYARRKNRVRRTSFVSLNITMWRFFKQCCDSGVPLNGKQLKEQAMTIARHQGLESFKGSEGWLDAFKRRHKIDLKQMSGCPANYDVTDDEVDDLLDDEASSNHDDSASNRPDYSLEVRNNEGTNATLLSCVESASAQPTAVASIQNTQPIDLDSLFGNNRRVDMTTGEVSNGSFLDPSAGFRENGLITSNGNHPSPGNCHGIQGLDESGLIASIVKSAAVRVPNQEVSYAMDTVRSFILATDPTVMPAFLDLQIRLSTIRDARNILEASANANPLP